MFKHFIFDIDGTLIDTEKTGVLSLIATIRQLTGKEMPYNEAYRFFGVPSSLVGIKLDYRDPEEFGEVWERNFVSLSHLIRPFDGVEQMLEAVKAAGRTVGCVTSRTGFEFGKDIHLQKIARFFDYTVCFEDSSKHKPDPEPVLTYIRKASDASGCLVAPQECIYIGDTVHDCLCSHGAGVLFALADWNGRGAGEIPADYHLRRIGEILSLLNP